MEPRFRTFAATTLVLAVTVFATACDTTPSPPPGEGTIPPPTAGSSWTDVTNPAGAVPHSRAVAEWQGDIAVEGPPADVRGLTLGCYSMNWGNYQYQGELVFDAEGNYSWLGEAAGVVAPTGRGADIAFTGSWSTAVGAISILVDGEAEIVVAWEYEPHDHLYWYCSS